METAIFFWTLPFEILGRNIAPLHFKAERVAETTLRKSWFWPAQARFPGTWAIFSNPRDSKQNADGLGLQSIGHSKTFWTLGLELQGRKIAPLPFKTHTVATTALRASWFWTASARFPGTWELFSSSGDSKLTPAGLCLQWNGQSKTFSMLALELLLRNIAPFHFKTQSNRDRLPRIVILSNFCSISRNLGNIFHYRGL